MHLVKLCSQPLLLVRRQFFCRRMVAFHAFDRIILVGSGSLGIWRFISGSLNVVNVKKIFIVGYELTTVMT